MKAKFLLTTLFLSLIWNIGFGQDPWINEIHYDNSGADINEGIEIAAPAGTDLACFDLVLYSGSSSYATINLSGVVPDEGCGYGAIWFSYSGLQNGSSDGVALYFDASNAGCSGSDYLVQFLSYEGTITASSGPGVINGQTSTDIGVSEGGSTANSSLQLIGNGLIYSDFS